MTAVLGSVLDVHIPGRPVTQGSMRSIGKGRMVSDNARLGPWRDTATLLLRAAWQGRPVLAGPVTVEITATFPQRASAPQTWALRPAWWHPVSRGFGDLDKICRAVCDAVTAAGVWTDDAQVVLLTARKEIAGSPVAVAAAPGVRVRVWPAP